MRLGLFKNHFSVILIIDKIYGNLNNTSVSLRQQSTFLSRLNSVIPSVNHNWGLSTEYNHILTRVTQFPQSPTE